MYLQTILAPITIQDGLCINPHCLKLVLFNLRLHNETHSPWRGWRIPAHVQCKSASTLADDLLSFIVPHLGIPYIDLSILEPLLQVVIYGLVRNFADQREIWYTDFLLLGRVKSCLLDIGLAVSSIAIGTTTALCLLGLVALGSPTNTLCRERCQYRPIIIFKSEALYPTILNYCTALHLRLDAPRSMVGVAESCLTTLFRKEDCEGMKQLCQVWSLSKCPGYQCNWCWVVKWSSTRISDTQTVETLAWGYVLSLWLTSVTSNSASSFDGSLWIFDFLSTQLHNRMATFSATFFCQQWAYEQPNNISNINTIPWGPSWWIVVEEWEITRGLRTIIVQASRCLGWSTSTKKLTNLRRVFNLSKATIFRWSPRHFYHETKCLRDGRKLALGKPNTGSMKALPKTLNQTDQVWYR